MKASVKLQRLMQEKCMTVTDLVQRLGYCRQHVSALVNGKRGISTETALRLATIFGTSIYFWLKDDLEL